LAYHETNKIKSRLQFEHSAGRIEIMHFDTDPPNILTFSALRGRRPLATGVESDIAVVLRDGDLSMHAQEVYILDGDAEEWGSKLDFYMKRMAQQFVDAESTNFVKQSVSLALKLGQTQEVIPSIPGFCLVPDLANTLS
jgi:hypothetical protein